MLPNRVIFTILNGDQHRLLCRSFTAVRPDNKSTIAIVTELERSVRLNCRLASEEVGQHLVETNDVHHNPLPRVGNILM